MRGAITAPAAAPSRQRQATIRRLLQTAPTADLISISGPATTDAASAEGSGVSLTGGIARDKGAGAGSEAWLSDTTGRAGSGSGSGGGGTKSVGRMIGLRARVPSGAG